MQPQSIQSGGAATPNDVFRRIRGHYFRMLGMGLGLGLLALIAGTNQLVPPWFIGLRPPTIPTNTLGSSLSIFSGGSV